MKRWLVVSILLTVLATAVSLVVYANRAAWLPEEVPTRWNAHGEPSTFTARDDMLVPLLLMPGTLAGVVVLYLILPWLSPQKFKIEPFRATYDYIMGLVFILCAYMHGVLLAVYLGANIDLGRWYIAGSLLIVSLLGNVLGKVQRNFWIGVRTPWTLASEAVWIRTHRLAAWLFMAGGVVGFVLVVCGVSPLIALTVFGVPAIVPVFYSLFLYKRLEREGKIGNGAEAQAR
jgi:uncharacterized membrane protein